MCMQCRCGCGTVATGYATIEIWPQHGRSDGCRMSGVEELAVGGRPRETLTRLIFPTRGTSYLAGDIILGV